MGYAREGTWIVDAPIGLELTTSARLPIPNMVKCPPDYILDSNAIGLVGAKLPSHSPVYS